MSLQFEVTTLKELPDVASAILKGFPNERIFAFFGEMGAGKTTFIKVLCEAMGVRDVTSSPTFSLVNEYLDAEGDSVYHFDFYRIENEREAFDIGFEDYLYSNAYCFIEWPERIEKLLPDTYVSISILEDNSVRTIKAESC